MIFLYRSIHYDLREPDVMALFSAFGKVVSCDMTMDAATGRSKGFCFLEYDNSQSADAAMAMNGFELAGRKVIFIAYFIIFHIKHHIIIFVSDQSRETFPRCWCCSTCKCFIIVQSTWITSQSIANSICRTIRSRTTSGSLSPHVLSFHFSLVHIASLFACYEFICILTLYVLL